MTHKEQIEFILATQDGSVQKMALRLIDAQLSGTNIEVDHVLAIIADAINDSIPAANDFDNGINLISYCIDQLKKARERMEGLNQKGGLQV